MSAYFLPDLAKTILRLCKDFPLWTNVIRNKLNSPYDVASSAMVENDFKELKTQILKFEVRPMTVDRFVVTHLNNIDANAKLLKSSLTRASKILTDNVSAENIPKKFKKSVESKKNLELSSNNSSDESVSIKYKCFDLKSITRLENDCRTGISIKSPAASGHDSDTSLNAIENWRGQGRYISKTDQSPKTIRKKKPTKYINPMPEIDKVLSSRHLRSNLRSFLLNGNLTTPIRFGKYKYIRIILARWIQFL